MIGIIEFFVLGIFCIPFFLIFIFIPFKIVFGTISFLYDRYTSEPQGAFDASEYVLKELAESWNGASYKFDSRHLCLLVPSRNLYILVTKDVRSSMTIYRDFSGTRIKKRRALRCGEVTLDNFQRFILQTEGFVMHTHSNREMCAYCKESLLDMDALQSGAEVPSAARHPIDYKRAGRPHHAAYVIRCFRCDAPHHIDCYQSNGGCSVYGCNLMSAGPPKNPAKASMSLRFCG